MRRSLSSKTILITAGPTREALDPVRFLSNQSSGAMGISLAAALRSMGARVLLVLGPTTLPTPRGVSVTRVTTAREMAAAVRRRLRRAHAFVSTAAVCDWRFDRTFRHKLKKGSSTASMVRLVRNPDILAEAGRRKSAAGRPVLVGFALETRDAARHAEEKLRRKNLDLVIGNSPISFGSATIDALWIERGGPAADVFDA